MIILDTNVASELMKPLPDPAVTDWLRTLGSREACIAATSLAELHFGLRLMPEGRRRTDLAAALTRFLERVPVLAFDERAADTYADLAARRRRAGNPISLFDGQIAAVARVAGATVATRDVGGFVGCGVGVVNPWNTGAGVAD